MVGNHAFTYNGQTAAQLRTFTSRSSQVSNSPPRHTGALVPTRSIAHGSQQLPDCDLFTTLLFDRRRAYQSISSASSGQRAISASAPTELSSLVRPTPALNLDFNINVHSAGKETPKNDDMGILGFRNMPKAPAMSRKRERPTETQTKMTTVKPQKRKPPVRVSPRLAKRQMTGANSKKKVDNKGGTTDKRRNNALLDAIIISSDEEDEEEAPILPCVDADVEEDVKPIFANAEPISAVTERIPGQIETIGQTDAEGLSDGPSDSDSGSRLTKDNPQHELTRMQTEHAQEMQRLRQELDAARTEIERIQQLQATAAKDRELEHVRAKNLAESRYATTLRDLENERKEIVQLTVENEGLRLQIDNTAAECDTLSKELADVKAARIKEKKEHESVLEEVTKAKAADTVSATNNLLSENQRLRAENERLKMAVEAAAAAASQSSTTTTPSTPLPNQAPLSPISSYSIFPTPPSSQQTHAPISPAFSAVFSPITKAMVESQKDDNIRKVYTKTKRRFDNLHSVAMHLVHCTRSMDLLAWGEFGKCLGKLQEILSEDEKERTRNGGRG